MRGEFVGRVMVTGESLGLLRTGFKASSGAQEVASPGGANGAGWRAMERHGAEILSWDVPGAKGDPHGRGVGGSGGRREGESGGGPLWVKLTVIFYLNVDTFERKMDLLIVTLGNRCQPGLSLETPDA